MFLCRFAGLTLEETALNELVGKVESTYPFEEPAGKNPFEEEDEKSEQNEQTSQLSTSCKLASPFHGLISRSFENHLNIFVESQDKYS